MNKFRLLCLAGLALAMSACDSGNQPGYTPESSKAAASTKVKTYVFGIFPVHNPTQTMVVYGPMIDYLSANIPEAGFQLEASKSHDEFLQKVFERRFDFALGNPYQSIESEEKGYRIFAKMHDDDFRGLILTRKDSPVQSLEDLRGKAISFPSPIALAAAMMPQEYMHTHGLKVADYESLYVGSQESSIMNVHLRKVAAGATYPLSWKTFQKDHPDIAADLQVKWSTDTLPSNAFIVRDDVPAELLAKVSKLLLSLHETESGKAMLERIPIDRFETADHQTYQSVREFRTRFSSEVRKLNPAAAPAAPATPAATAPPK